jgi:hypothetical protein
MSPFVYVDVVPLVEFVHVVPAENWGLVFTRPFIDTSRVVLALLFRAVSFACFEMFRS